MLSDEAKEVALVDEVDRMPSRDEISLDSLHSQSAADTGRFFFFRFTFTTSTSFAASIGTSARPLPLDASTGRSSASASSYSWNLP